MRTDADSVRTDADTTECRERLSLIIMCHDALLQNLDEARRLQNQREPDAAREKNRRAIKIVNDLAVGLDYERGGDIARDLGWIYHSVMDQLKDMNGCQDCSMYDRLIRLFEGLRGAWEFVSLRNH